MIDEEQEGEFKEEDDDDDEGERHKDQEEQEEEREKQYNDDEDLYRKFIEDDSDVDLQILFKFYQYFFHRSFNKL